MIIRKAIEEDASQIAEVMLDFYNMKNSQEAIDAFKSEMSKDHKYILALEDGRIIGLVTWLMHGLPKHGLFELDRICILKKSRGKGAGKILVESLINDARNWYQDNGFRIRKLYLLTHEDNTAAHEFYEKVGFKHEATLDSHYYEQKDERVYSLFFNEP